MQDEITREQKGQLKTWAGQRDVLLSEISILRDENSKLEKANIEISASYTEVADRIKFSEGRLLELRNNEIEYEAVMDVALAQKIMDKAILENQIPLLEKEVASLEFQKNSLMDMIKMMQSINSGFAAKNIELEKQIGGVIALSEKNAGVVNSLMESLKVSTTELIDTNKKNVEETNIVINQLPRMVVELQKHGLIKKI